MNKTESQDVFKRIVELRQHGGEAVLVTVIRCKGSTPRKQGAKMLVFADGSICGTVGGGIREADIISTAQELLKNGQETKLVSVDFSEGLTGGKGPVCGGNMELFMERIQSKRALVLGGAGHISRSLYLLALQLDYRVIVIDPRPELNSPDRFAEAQRIIRDFERGVGDIEITSNDAVVLVGPNHEADQVMLPSVLESKAGYIGMIGSKRKRKEVYDALVARYGLKMEDLESIYSPIGLDIGSESPEEIAIAIIAEIIKHFKEKQTDGNHK
jgi:xanthine dehydrogenase accessory factor